MLPELSPRWRAKANDFFSTSGVKLKQAGQSAGENVAEAAEKVGSVVKSRWALLREARERRAAGPPGEPLQERLVLAVATTGLLLRKGVLETKEKVVVGKTKVEEAAKKTADKSKSILTNIERWQKGVATNDGSSIFSYVLAGSYLHWTKSPFRWLIGQEIASSSSFSLATPTLLSSVHLVNT